MSVLTRHAQAAPKIADEISYKIASTRVERENAFRLVYQSYVRSGLADPNPHQMRVSPYHLLPTTQIFVAMLRDEVVFTASLVSDDAMGLPMESVYPEEVALRRQQGHRLAEVTCLADRRARFRGFVPVFLKIGQILIQYAQQQQLDQLLVAVHPRHAGFYQRLLRFESIGDEKDYPMVRNRPAVPLVLDLASVQEKHPDDYDAVYGKRIPDHQLRPIPMSSKQRDYFFSIVEASSAEAELPDTVL